MKHEKITSEDKSRLFSRMWAIAGMMAKVTGGTSRDYLSPALKMAWKELKEEKGLPETVKRPKTKKVAAGHYTITKNFHKFEIVKVGRVWAIRHRGVTAKRTFPTLKAAVEIVHAA